MEAARGGAERTLLTDPRAVTLSLVSFVTTFGVQVVSPTLPAIATAFGVAEAEIGLVMTAYTLPGIVAVPVIGMLADVYGRRVVLLPTFLCMCVLGVAIAAADGFQTILVLRLGQGIVVAGIMPMVTTVLGDLYAGAVGTTAQGIRLSANGAANVAIPVAAGFLAGFAWNYPFLLYLLGAPVLVAAYLVLPETGSRTASRGFATELRDYLGALRPVLTDRIVLVLVASGLFRGFGFYTIITFLPLFAARGFGASTALIGAILAIRGAIRLVVSPFAGRFLGVVSRRWGLVGGLGLMAVGTALIALAPSIGVLALGYGLWGLGDAVQLPIHRDSVAVFSTPESRAGVMSGVSLLRKVGTTAAPILMGVLLAATGFAEIFLVVAGLFVAYALLLVVYFVPADES